MAQKFYGEVYLVTCLVNKRKYVGITTRGFLDRWKRHIRASLKEKDDYRFHRAIRKYGSENFKIEVLEGKSYVNPERLANWLFKREKHWIKFYDSNHVGYNMTEGGDGVPGLIISKEGKKAISERMKKFYKDNPEMRKKVVQRAHEEARKPENRKRMSELQKKRYEEMTDEERLEHIEKTKQGMNKLSTETKERIKKTQFKKNQEAWNKGIETPEEVRRKISESEKGRLAWNKGILMPEGQKKKISESRKGIQAWNKGTKVERKETCPACGKLICWNMMNKHLKARHEKK